MRRDCVEVPCARCKRTEYIDKVVGADPAPPGINSFSAALVVQGEQVLDICFEELCRPCSTTIRNHLEAISRKMEKVSPDRVAKPKKVSLHSLSLADPVAKKKAQG